MREEAAEEFEDDGRGENKAERDNKAVIREEGEFEEVAGERPEENHNHDSDDGDKEGGAKLVEGARNPIDKNQVNDKGGGDGGSRELIAWKIVETGDN